MFYFVRSEAKRLIEENGVDTFYICHQGRFDKTAAIVVDHLRHEYPNIRLKYALPDGKGKKELAECMKLAELEYDKQMPPAKAISKRYLGMLQSVDFVIASCRNEQAVEPLLHLAEKYNTEIRVIKNRES